jgi:hypothetical protein
MSEAIDKPSKTVFLNGDMPTTAVRNSEFFGRGGKPLSKEEYHRVIHYAKIVESLEADFDPTYYVRVYQGTLFDPMGPYGKRQRNLDTQMKKVSKNTFDFYITYLMTNNSIYLTRAQRGFLND